MHVRGEIRARKIRPLPPAKIFQLLINSRKIISPKRSRIRVRQSSRVRVPATGNLRGRTGGLLRQRVIGVGEAGDGRVFPILPRGPLGRYRRVVEIVAWFAYQDAGVILRQS